MSTYHAPLRDMQFVLREIAPLETIAALPGCEEATPDVVAAVLEEAGKFAAGVLSPMNRPGDEVGARWADGPVTTAPGWREGYRQFIDGGWNALSCHPEYGGQGLPRLVSCLVEEMWNGANMAFTLCPMLTRGAIEALELRGTDAQKQTYLPKLVSGEWTGTMLLTEPQAGSDLSAVRTRAVAQPDGSVKLHGTKIFITYGEHDLTDNIIHLVLARSPDGPPGVRGLSLYVMPKMLVEADGSPGARNDVQCVSIEHKLGIHASPTAVLALGENGGATAWLVGEENRGIETMFIMMNAARYAVGLEGVGLAERSYQRAVEFARQRVQGAELGTRSADKVAIIRHPDVRRMLMSMKARTEAMRAMACVTAAAMDTARCSPDEAQRATANRFVDLMIPIVKGWSTEHGLDIASLGVQVHGGMGFIEETGAAQHLRDARITTIYEGTTGIQAADLMGRKVARDGGGAIGEVIAQMHEVKQQLADSGDAQLEGFGTSLAAAIGALELSVAHIVAHYGDAAREVSVGAVPFLDLFGTVAGGWQMARAALASQRQLAAGSDDDAFYRAKLATAAFYAQHVLPAATGLAHAVQYGAPSALALDDADF